MTFRHTLFVTVMLMLIIASTLEARVVKQVQMSRDVPTWRSAVRVRQIQGNFPRLSSFYEGGSRPQLFGRWTKREEGDTLELDSDLY